MAVEEPLTFGALLSRYRAAALLTQEELAERAGLSARGVSDLERGVKTRPRPYTVRQLSEALQLSIDDRATFEQAALAAAEESRSDAVLPEGNFLGALPAHPLVVRDEEVERIRSILDAATDGAGHLLLMGGEMGCGKTRLLQHLMVEARDRSVEVLMGRCYRAEQATPLYPVLEALGGLDTHLLPSSREAHRDWLGIQQIVGEYAADCSTGRAVAQQRIFSAVGGLLLLVARSRPVAVLLDDLHWADVDTLKLLQHLAHATRASPVLLAGSFRDVRLSEEHPDLTLLLHDLSRERLIERITVRRLSLEETTQLVAATMGQRQVSEEFASFVYRRTKGNPRLIDQLVRSLGGRLELQGEIGAGSMGRVFRAYDRTLQKTVAAKLVLARTEIELDSLMLFQQEGAVLAALDHPNIVAIHDTFAEEHASCIIMELLDGQSLSQILQDGPLPLARARALAVQVADALSYAHAQSIVHRDIKPDNVMVLEGDRVKVTDFGIARILQSDRSLQTMATTGMRMGTPLYMAPEQIAGKQIDGRTDIYALCAVLYHMVTGRPPFEGSDVLEVVVKHLHDEPSPPSSIDPAIPAAWDALILKGLAKDPQRRFGTATDLQEGLRSLPLLASGVAKTGKRRRASVARWPPNSWPAASIAVGAILAVAVVFVLVALVRLHSTSAASTTGGKIDSYLQGLARQGKFSGAVLVAQRGSTLVDEGYGMADRSHHVPNTPTTTYPIPGVNLTMFLAAGLRLEEQGNLSDRAAICRYLPRCPATWKHFTLHAVLDGTAHLPVVDRGLVYNHSTRQSLAACEAAPLPTTLALIAEYNNCTVVVLGTIFEHTTGKPWAAVMQETVFKPAGMRNSGRVPDARSGARTQDYPGTSSTGVATHFDDYFQIYSTAQDVLAYDNVLRAGKLLSRRSLQRLFAPGPIVAGVDPHIANVRQNNAWREGTVLGRPVTYTSDTTFGFSAANLRFPRDSVTVIVISNDERDDVENVAIHAASLVFGASPVAVGTPHAAVLNAAAAVVARIVAAQPPGAGAFLDRALWTPIFDTGKILRIDASTNRVAASITYGHQETVNPQQNPNVATTVDGQLWVTDRGSKSIVRLDPSTNRVIKRVHVGIHAQNLAGAAGSLWVSSYDDDSVVRVDLGTDTVVARLTKLGRPTDIAAGDGALWVAVKNTPHVIRIDPVSNRVVATISVGTDPQSVAVGTGAVWVNNGNGNELFRIDPASNRVVATIPLDRSAGVRTDQSCGCQSVAAGNGSTWALAHDEHQLVRVDPRTNRIDARLTIPTPHGASPLITFDVLMGEGSLWIDAERYVIRINPHSA